MTAPKTWVIVAAERRELEGILKRFGSGEPVSGIRAQFAREIAAYGDRWILIANGPGGKLATEPLNKNAAGGRAIAGIASTGFCGALDPALRIGDIVREVVTLDRVAVTVEEKRKLRETTQARAVDMESAALGRKAAEWGVEFKVIRVVSDAAEDNMPLDFNLYRDRAGRFSRTRIALGAMGDPLRRVPGLLRLDRNCRMAAERLGEFFAHCRL